MAKSVPLQRLVLGLTVGFVTVFPVGFHLSVLNIPQSIFTDYVNETYQKTYGRPISTEFELDQLWSFIVAVFYGGAIVGALLTNFVAEKWGRKAGLFVMCNAISVVGSLFQAFSKITSFEMLATGRFVTGIGAGMACGLSVLFLTECAPVEYRGVAGSTPNLCTMFFNLFGQILSLPQLLGSTSNWQYLLGLGLIPCILQLPFIFYFHESPKHLYITKNNHEAAKRSIEFYQGKNVDYSDLFKEYDDEKVVEQEQIGYITALKTPELRKPLIICCVASIAQLSTGIVCIYSYSTSMFQTAGVSVANSDYAAIGVTGSNFMGTVVSLPFIMKVNRRTLLFTGLALTNTCLLLFMVTSLINYYSSGNQWAAYISIIIILTHVFVFSFGPGPIPWFLAAELMPQNARSFGMSASIAVNWILSLISAMVYLPLQNKMGPYCILLFLAVGAACGIFLYFTLPETRNKTITEISASFSKSVHPADEPVGRLTIKSKQ